MEGKSKGKLLPQKKKFIKVVSAFQPTKISDQRRKEIHNQVANQQNLEFLYLKENRSLNLVFLGMDRYFCNQNSAAKSIQIRNSQIREGIYFSYFGWKRVDKTMEESKRFQQADNINHLRESTQYFWTLSKRYHGFFTLVSLWLVTDCRELLMAMNPELVFRGWIKKWTSANDQHKRKYLELLAGLRSKSLMEKYGMKVAAELVSDEIATGKVYNGEKIFFSEGTVQMCHLLQAGRVIIEKDFCMQRQEERQMKQPR